MSQNSQPTFLGFVAKDRMSILILALLIFAALMVRYFIKADLHTAQAVIQVGQIGDLGPLIDSKLLVQRINASEELEKSKVRAEVYDYSQNTILMSVRLGEKENSEATLKSRVSQIVNEHKGLFDSERKKYEELHQEVKDMRLFEMPKKLMKGDMNRLNGIDFSKIPKDVLFKVGEYRSFFNAYGRLKWLEFELNQIFSDIHSFPTRVLEQGKVVRSLKPSLTSYLVLSLLFSLFGSIFLIGSFRFWNHLGTLNQQSAGN